MKIKEFLKSLLLSDIIKSLLFEVKAAFKKPVTIKNLQKLERKCLLVDQKNCIKCLVCVGVCPSDSIHLSSNNKIEINRKKCADCGLCEKACPKGCISKRKIK